MKAKASDDLRPEHKREDFGQGGLRRVLRQAVEAGKGGSGSRSEKGNRESGDRGGKER